MSTQFDKILKFIHLNSALGNYQKAETLATSIISSGTLNPYNIPIGCWCISAQGTSGTGTIYVNRWRLANSAEAFNYLAIYSNGKISGGGSAGTLQSVSLDTEYVNVCNSVKKLS